MKKISENIIISPYSIFEEYLIRDKKWILVNTVNCEWFMGKGIALEFKVRFWDEYFLDYSDNCEKWTIKVWSIDYNEKFKIVNFPTKSSYKRNSKIEWIIYWLDDFCKKVELWFFDNNIIYVPKLWSSNWWQNWEEVLQIIKDKLLSLKNDKVKFIICEDKEAWDIEKEIIDNLRLYNWTKIPEKVLNEIRKNFYKIKRLRHLFDIKWVWEKTYKDILDLEIQESLF